MQLKKHITVPMPEEETANAKARLKNSYLVVGAKQKRTEEQASAGVIAHAVFFFIFYLYLVHVSRHKTRLKRISRQ
jgi:hypothetical protein